MIRMLNRRVFGTSMAAALFAPAGWPVRLMGETTAEPGDAASRFSVMIWTLRNMGSFEENLERVAQAGYRHVELVGEFKKWSAEDTRRILARMQALKISIDATTVMTLGFADPAGGDAFIAELKRSIPVVRGLGCSQIIMVSGKRIEGVAPEVQHRACVETLKRSAEVLSAENMVCLLEPIDRLENPPIYLNGVTEAFEISRAVGSPHVKVLYDLYHEQREFGNLIEKLEKNIDQVGLIHIADVPGRHEPGTGEMNYGNIYRKLGQLKYEGMIAMEFYPTGDVVEELRRAREHAVSAMAAGRLAG
jgi:hydroxypyruvate isomerase